MAENSHSLNTTQLGRCVCVRAELVITMFMTALEGSVDYSGQTR